MLAIAQNRANMFNGQFGFSLVEVVVAGAILGLVTTAVVVMIGNSNVLGMEGDHFRQARILAQHELEDPWTHFLQGGFVNKGEDMLLDLNETGHQPIPARVEVVFQNHQADFGDGIKIPYKIVKSTVSWTENSGKSAEVTVSKRIVVLR